MANGPRQPIPEWLPQSEAELLVWWPLLLLAGLVAVAFQREAMRGWRTGRLRLRGGELRGRWARFGAVVLTAIAWTIGLIVLRGALHHLQGAIG
jgi:hypothetical protein